MMWNVASSFGRNKPQNISYIFRDLGGRCSNSQFSRPKEEKRAANNLRVPLRVTHLITLISTRPSSSFRCCRSKRSWCCRLGSSCHVEIWVGYSPGWQSFAIQWRFLQLDPWEWIHSGPCSFKKLPTNAFYGKLFFVIFVPHYHITITTVPTATCTWCPAQFISAEAKWQNPLEIPEVSQAFTLFCFSPA